MLLISEHLNGDDYGRREDVVTVVSLLIKWKVNRSSCNFHKAFSPYLFFYGFAGLQLLSKLCDQWAG